MNSLLQIEIDFGIASLTMSRPDKRNALSRDLISELGLAFDQLQANEAVRCVILSGAGSVFCSGADLDELRSTLSANPEVIWQDAQRLNALFDTIYSFPKPTIAAINGSAVAGGAGLVTACDLALSVPEAKFGYPEVRRGLVAAMVLPHLLRHVGERMARYLLLTGELIDSAAALRSGLINQVVPAEDLMTTAKSWATSCLQGGPKSLESTKRLLRGLHHSAFPSEDLARESAQPRFGEECKEGLAAFFEKKLPPWCDK